MESRQANSVKMVIGILASILTVAAVAQAGPALICHRIDIGQAKSLPWPADAGTLQGDENYNLQNLVTDTLGILNPSTPVLVRMETLRRATLYAHTDPVLAKQLLLKLYARATSAEAVGKPDALAWFDAGYLAECYREWNEAVHLGLGQGRQNPIPVAGLDGYGWVKKAIGLRGSDAEMEFAAALITIENRNSDHREQVQKAIAGANHDSLLAQNVATHILGE